MFCITYYYYCFERRILEHSYLVILTLSLNADSRQMMKQKLKYIAILTFLIFGIVNFGFQVWYHLNKDMKLSIRYYNVPLNREITEFELAGKINHQNILTTTSNTTKDGTNTMYYPGQRIPELKASAFQELSHEVLKRKLTYEEYNEYKELIFDTSEIFRRNNIR